MRTVSLIIGNSSYPLDPIPYAKKTAERIFVQLQAEAGVTSAMKSDATRSEVENALRSLASSATGADVVMFIFIGHAFQFNDENYLVPIDAKDNDVVNSSIKMNWIHSQLLTAAPGASCVFIYDASRPNSFQRIAQAANNGLCSVEAPLGSLISLSAAPNPARGVDIELLLRRVRRDVLETSAGRQVPWTSACLVRDVVVCPYTSGPAVFAEHAAVFQPSSPMKEQPNVYAVLTRLNLSGAEDVAIVQNIADLERCFISHYDAGYSITGMVLQDHECLVTMRQADEIGEEIFRTSTSPHLREVIDEMWGKGWREIVHAGYGLGGVWVLVFRKTCSDVAFKYARNYDEVTRYVEDRLDSGQQAWRITCLTYMNHGWFVALGANSENTHKSHQRISCAGTWKDAAALIDLYHSERYIVCGVAYSAEEQMWLVAAAQQGTAVTDSVSTEKLLSRVPQCVEKEWANGRRVLAIFTGSSD